MNNDTYDTHYQLALPTLERFAPLSVDAQTAEVCRPQYDFPMDGPLKERFEMVAALAAQRYSKSTRRIYLWVAKRFVRWAVARGVSHLPADPKTVLEYLIAMSRKSRFSTVSNTLGAIDFYQECGGYERTRDDARLRRFLRELRRRQPAPIIPTLTPKDVRALAELLGDDPTDKRNLTIIVLGFFGALDSTMLRKLDRSMVEFLDDAVRVGTKDGKFRTIGAGSDPKTDPVRVVRAWLEYVGTKPGALLCPIVKGRCLDKPLSNVRLNRIFAKLLKKAGLSTARGGISNLRRSFIMCAAEADIRALDIMSYADLKKLESVTNITGTIGQPYELRMELDNQKTQWGRRL